MSGCDMPPWVRWDYVMEGLLHCDFTAVVDIDACREG